MRTPFCSSFLRKSNMEPSKENAMHPNADEIFQTCTGFNLRLCRLGISDSISPAHSSTLLCNSGFGRSLSLSLALSGRARLDSGDMWRCCGRNATFWSRQLLTDNWPSDTMRCNIWNTQLTLAHAFVKWLFSLKFQKPWLDPPSPAIKIPQTISNDSPQMVCISTTGNA